MNNQQDGYAYRPAVSFGKKYKMKAKWKYLPIANSKILVTKGGKEGK